MAPINFEDNIREKLEVREIQPSADAWKKLNEQLDNTGEKKSSRVIWYAVAASFIGVLIAVSVFSTRNDKSVNNTTEFVNVNTTEGEVDETEDVNSAPNTSEVDKKVILASEELNSANQNRQVDSKIEKQIPKKIETSHKNTIQNNTEAIAKISVKTQNENLSPLPNKRGTNEEQIIKSRINELVAQVELVQQTNEIVTTDEVDALLANAARDLQSKKAIPSTRIDPNALLGDVETEMDNSFRDKVFTALGDGYNIIKTAVVNRNN